MHAAQSEGSPVQFWSSEGTAGAEVGVERVSMCQCNFFCGVPRERSGTAGAQGTWVSGDLDSDLGGVFSNAPKSQRQG